MQYRRAYSHGGSYFFTLVTDRRKPVFCNDDAIIILQNAFRQVKQGRPFSIDAIVILPDHLHCVWTLPMDDDDFSTRWRLIKTHFTKIYHSRAEGGDVKIWQNCFWEHRIRNEKDYHHHVDYIHYNLVKHGHVTRPSDWPYSSFQKFVKSGLYDEGWGSSDIDIPECTGKE